MLTNLSHLLILSANAVLMADNQQIEDNKMTFEEAVAYFKSFYQNGTMKFPEVYTILYSHGWSVQLIKDGGPVWTFTPVK